MAAAEVEVPFHLRGNYAPVQQEVTAFDLPVTGAIPRELTGLYLRNGPNPKSGTSAHWFVGDGMMHGVRLENGRAAWYRNRWVRTKLLENPELSFVQEDGSVDRTVVVANTNVIGHAGRIYALVENGFPTELGVASSRRSASATSAASSSPRSPRTRSPARRPASCTSSATASSRPSSPTTCSTRPGTWCAASRSPCPARP